MTTPSGKIYREILYEEADDFFDSLNQAINHAAQEILLETFIFDLDPVGEEVLTNLIKASNRGVKILLYLDGHGVQSWGHDVFKRLAYSGIHWKIHHPMPWQLDCRTQEEFLEQTTVSLKKLNLFKNDISLLFKRNHQKKCLIDNKIGFFGSINISKDHSQKMKGPDAWKDIGIKVRDERINKIREYFFKHYLEHDIEHDLEHDNEKTLSHPGHLCSHLRPAWNLEQKKYYRNDLFRRILQAKKRVWIATPYFIPDEEFIQHLSQCQALGVDIKVLIPLKTDYAFFTSFHRHYAQKLQKRNIDVFFSKKDSSTQKCFLSTLGASWDQQT